MKVALLVIGILSLFVGLTDILLGNTGHNVLPSFLSDHLDQQEDVFFIALGAGALYLAHKQT